ncbi:MAG: S8 family peptidase [Bryobacteraceae bacterium]
MSYLRENLKAAGSAKVICVLKKDAKPTPAKLRSWSKRFHFTQLHEEAQRQASQGPAQESGFVFAKVPDSAMQYFPNLNVAFGSIQAAGLNAIQADPLVKSVHSIPPLRAIQPVSVKPVAAVSDTSFQLSWGLETLGIDRMWAQGLTGRGVKVGHLDTGVDGTHPALEGVIGSFVQFDLLGQPMPGDLKPFDTDGHGTHSAGVIAGRPALGRAVGVAPGATLVSGIVIEGGNVIARVLAGIDWAIGKNIKILNLSVGLPGFFKDFQPIMQRVRQLGILPVVAVGNDGPNNSDSPGNYPQALSVGASAQDGSIASISSSQRFNRPDDPLVPDLVAPGVDIISTDKGGGFRAETGTSAATPHMSGLAALLWEAKPAATAQEIESAIYASCTLAATATADRANRGIPDGPKALQALLQPVAAAAGGS